MKKKDDRYIPINKGHFELDTPERTKEFQKKLSYGWKDEYNKYRKLWVDLPKKRQLREYPLLVDLELSSICNLKCPMCYTITDEFKKKVTKGLMDFDLFERIVDEIAGKVYALRLSLRGEPTLHGNFIEAIKYAKQKGIKEVSSLTNGSRLTLEYFSQVAEAGLDWLTVSIDGTDEMYESIRRPLKFSDTIKKIMDIKTFKERNGLIRPVIKVQGIWPAIRPNPTLYYNSIAPYVDLIAYNPLIDYLRKDNEIVYEDNFACPQLYQRLVVGSDGLALLCSNDEDGEEIIGNVYNQSIHEIWHSDKMNGIRDIHNSKGGSLNMKVCRQCYYPRKAIPDELVRVNGREIWIENYVNRKQKVGE